MDRESRLRQPGIDPPGGPASLLCTLTSLFSASLTIVDRLNRGDSFFFMVAIFSGAEVVAIVNTANQRYVVHS